MTAVASFLLVGPNCCTAAVLLLYVPVVVFVDKGVESLE